MKTRMLVLSLALALLLGTIAQAAGPMRAVVVEPTLTFSGTTATCTASVQGSVATDSISVTMKLWNGNTCLKTWTGSGTYRVSLSKPATVSHGQTYKLTVDYTINGVAQPQKSTIRICP